MKKASTIVLIVILSGCKDTDDPATTSGTGIWFDRGIQCMSEMKGSTFNLDQLPQDIKSDLADYLNLEYGAPQYSDPIKIEEITYMGEFEACYSKIKIWNYVCNDPKGCYVGVQPWRDTYYTGTVSPEFKIE